MRQQAYLDTEELRRSVERETADTRQQVAVEREQAVAELRRVQEEAAARTVGAAGGGDRVPPGVGRPAGSRHRRGRPDPHRSSGRGRAAEAHRDQGGRGTGRGGQGAGCGDHASGPNRSSPGASSSSAGRPSCSVSASRRCSTSWPACRPWPSRRRSRSPRSTTWANSRARRAIGPCCAGRGRWTGPAGVRRPARADQRTHAQREERRRPPRSTTTVTAPPGGSTWMSSGGATIVIPSGSLPSGTAHLKAEADKRTELRPPSRAVTTARRRTSPPRCQPRPVRIYRGYPQPEPPATFSSSETVPDRPSRLRPRGRGRLHRRNRSTSRRSTKRRCNRCGRRTASSDPTHRPPAVACCRPRCTWVAGRTR